MKERSKALRTTGLAHYLGMDSGGGHALFFSKHVAANIRASTLRAV